MKKIHKSTFFIVVALIALFTVSALTGFDYYYGDNKTTVVKGINDIRLGIDIQGGVDVTFAPADGFDASDKQLDAATATLKTRLSTLGINDNEIYSDYKSDRIIVRFPWQAGESDFDAETAVKELGEMAELTFRRGDEYDVDEEGNITPTGEIILNGADIENADYMQQPDNAGNYQWVVTLALKESGRLAFADATAQLAGSSTPISIWMDSTMISAPTVNTAITDGNAIITGNFDTESSKKLADQINSGALPFKMETTSFKTISSTMGEGSLDAIILAAFIAIAFIAIYMIILYKVPGLVAVIGIIGQIAATLAAVTGWFGFMPGSTLTIPGIAGIILSAGMGVDANIITGERIKEEIRSGKGVLSSVKYGFKGAFSSIIDSNITTIIAAVVLMIFGTGTVTGFAITLLIGVLVSMFTALVITRFIMNTVAKLGVNNPKLYGM